MLSFQSCADITHDTASLRQAICSNQQKIRGIPNHQQVVNTPPKNIFFLQITGISVEISTNKDLFDIHLLNFSLHETAILLFSFKYLKKQNNYHLYLPLAGLKNEKKL
tara:strand:+ start:111 stop:434 length:324 start_codon:yes stop_codon:yes gene_type:complete